MFSCFLFSWPLRTGPEGTWWYDDAMNWITGLLLLAWLGWYLVNRYLRLKALRRPRRGRNSRSLKQAVKRKRELSSRYLRPGFSANIHAVGVGTIGRAGAYCIQIFANDLTDELWTGSGTDPLPESYRGIPLVLVEMPSAGFLSEGIDTDALKHMQGIRDSQAVIVGGISGANTNLTGESGTIGYFCTRRSRIPRRKEVHLLSNSHVFADLRRTKADESDVIMQPSPGERGSNRPIGTLADFATVKFGNDLAQPNHIDAAIAKLWSPQPHQALIPLIGAVKGYVETKDVVIGESVRKFGRTTGYTEGRLFSIYLDIRIRYDRTGQSAFFQDQFLIEAAPQFTKFVSGGDSGSLVVDAGQYAIGLIFAGSATLPETLPPLPKPKPNDPATAKAKKIEGYGIANPIRAVLDGLKIDLMI